MARFNTKLDDDYQDKRYFQGLPSPGAAALLAGFVWVSYEYGVSGRDVFFGILQWKWMAWGLTVFAGASMVSDLRYYSGKDINLKRSVPFFVKWFVKFEEAKGSKEQAMRNLDMVVKKGRYFGPFARILMAVVALREKRRQDARVWLEGLVREFPENKLLLKELDKISPKIR